MLINYKQKTTDDKIRRRMQPKLSSRKMSWGNDEYKKTWTYATYKKRQNHRVYVQLLVL